MKKKFINGLLLAALFLGFTGSVVSCKDYDDEKYKDLQGELADTQTTLRAALDKQAQQITDLTKSLNECMNTCSEFRDSVDKKFKDYLTVIAFNDFKGDLETKLAKIYTKTEIDQKFSGLDDKYYTKTQVDNLLAELEGKLDNYYTKTGIDSLLTSKLKDYYTKEEIDLELKKYVQTNAVAQTIADLLNAGDATLTGALNTFFVNDPVVVEYLEKGKGAEIINKHITAALVSVNDSIGKAWALADKANSLAKSNKIEIDKLKGITDTLRLDIISLGDKVDSVSTVANTAAAQALLNYLMIVHLDETVTSLGETVGDLAEGMGLLAAKVEEELQKADELHRQMLETISGLVEALDGQGETISDVQTSIENIINVEITNINNDITTINGDITTINGDIITINNNITELNKDITATTNKLAKYFGFFENVVAKFITGIELNGTFNDAFGGIALPFDVRSNILLAYYGKLDDYGVQFPTNRPAYYALPAANQWETITDEDIAMIGNLSDVEGYLDGKNGNKDIVSKDGAEGNAGTLYLTVNPTDRDFTDTEFSLINSRNEESFFKLGDLRKSDHLLTFGYTRAGVKSQNANGFYEAKATITAEDIKKSSRNTASIDFDGLVSTLKDVKNYQDGINFTEIFNTVFGAVSTLEANAVKTTWEDSLGTRSVVSQYGIAAAALKPLSFSFLKDVDVDNIMPTATIESFLDRIISAVMAQMPEFKVPEYVVESADVVADLGDGFYLMNVTVTKDNGASKAIVQVKVNKGNETKWNSNIDNIMDMVNDYIRLLNNVIDADEVEAKAHKALNTFIDELNKRFSRFLTPNKYLQPVLLVKAAGSYARLSESHNYPARVNKTELALVPTTYNAEILAPAYKKFIAVTNVSKGAVSAKGGDATCKKVLDAANKQENIKKVIDGGFATIAFDVENGYTYEILYSAVDYAGKVATKKFYVTVNE